MPDIKTIADKADVIINGYAFTRNEDLIQVLNLNSPDKAVVFSADGRWFPVQGNPLSRFVLPLPQRCG